MGVSFATADDFRPRHIAFAGCCDLGGPPPNGRGLSQRGEKRFLKVVQVYKPPV